MGLGAMDRARAWIERTGVRLLEAEVWRMHGEWLVDTRGATHLTGASHLAHFAEAEACFRDALAVARGQGSRWGELRAAMSLARLRERRGETYAAELAEARQCLHAGVPVPTPDPELCPNPASML